MSKNRVSFIFSRYPPSFGDFPKIKKQLTKLKLKNSKQEPNCLTFGNKSVKFLCRTLCTVECGSCNCLAAVRMDFIGEH